MHKNTLIRGFGADQRGVAAIEMALIGSLMATALMSVVEVSRYAYLATQVAAASQAGAQAAIVNCPPTSTPVTTNCPAVGAAVEVAIEGTTLTDEVSLGEPLKEGWYCINSADSSLTLMGDAGAKPSSCSSSSASSTPALYLKVVTTYKYHPIFPGLTLVEAFPKDIVRTAWMRMK